MKEFILDIVSENHIEQMITKFAALDLISHIYGDDMRIAFKKAAYITPATAVILLAIRDELAKNGKQLFFSANELRDNPALVTFFHKSGLIHSIPEKSKRAVNNVQLLIDRKESSSRFFIHAINLDALRQSDSAIASACLLSEALTAVNTLELIDNEFSNTLISRIMELLNNSLCHSNSAIVYLMVAQDKTDGYLISVYDRGIGIPGAYSHYSSSHQLRPLSDQEAIRWSIQQGNSTLQYSGDFPRGAGLYTIYELIDQCHGWMSIASRNGAYIYKDGAEQMLHMPLRLTGTMLLLHIPSAFAH